MTQIQNPELPQRLVVSDRTAAKTLDVHPDTIMNRLAGSKSRVW
jgi:hypothetical protein